MKKLLPYILALFAFMACTTEPQEERIGMDPSLEGKPVTVTFSLPDVRLASLSTKTGILDEGVGDITEEPYLDPERLYLVVCGTNQSIKYIRKAKLVGEPTSIPRTDITDYPISDPDAPLPETVTLYTFQVQLELSDSKRTVHFLGNVDEDQLITGSYASQVLPSLLSYEMKQAYWQRVFLKEIHPKVNKTTQEPELDDKGYYLPDDYVKERLKYVPLIRNYAKIQVTNNADKEELEAGSKFHLESYAVIQYPTRGSVVPYRTNTQGDPFSFDVSQENRLSGYELCNYEKLDKTLNYPGNLPSGVSFNYFIPTEDMFLDPAGAGKGKVLPYVKDSDQGFYIFERGVPTASLDPTFVIIRGYFGELTETTTHYYYRLDLMETQQVADESLSQYYPIYRNFRYDIVLNRISNEGVLTPELAAKSSTIVDISADVSMRHLSDISNGRTRLVVEPFMTRTYTGPSKEGHYTLYARFFNDINSANPNKNPGAVTVELEPMDDNEEDILILYDDDNNPVVHGGKYFPRAQWTDDVNGDGVENDDEGGYRVIHFDCKDVKYDVTKIQKIKITGRNLYSTYGELPLYREVEISLQQKQDMEVSCSEKELALQQGAKQTVSITIPSGLPTSMFPLTFIIEAEDVTLTPDNEIADNNLPVRSGTSLSENEKYRGKTTIQFIRTLTLDEYQQKTSGSTCTFNSYFKSNRIESATTVWVEDVDKYFNKKFDTFKNSGLPTNFFYVLAKEDDTKVKISSSGLSYKLITSGSEEGEWKAYTSNNVITLNNNDKVYFKAGNSNIYDWSGGKKFYCYHNSADAKDGLFVIGGNIASLIDGKNFETNELKNWVFANSYSFAEFFKGHTRLYDASDLVLPMTKCFTGCYKSMFDNCSGLIYTPQNLPATELATSCYESMFSGCANILSIPDGFLPATTLADACYKAMFKGCKNLASLQEELMPATNLATSCYESMFEDCNLGLTSIPAGLLPATTLAQACYKAMFKGCKNLIFLQAELLPATNLATSCYESMFENCDNQYFTSVPSSLLPASTLAESCYRGMFLNCKKIENAPELPAITSAASCYQSMFEGCVALATPPSTLPITTVENFACNKMFYGCSSLESAPEFSDSLSEVKESGCSEMFYNCSKLKTPPSSLPAGTLRFKAYYRMFWSCSKLESIPNFPNDANVEYTLTAGKSAENNQQDGLCYQMFYKCDALTTLEGKQLFNNITPLKLGCFNDMFSTCALLETVPEGFLPATTLAPSCYRGMFQNCPKLKRAPDLPATKLVDNCYRYMFYACSSLNYIRCLATNPNNGAYCANWVNGGVASSGTFVKDPGTKVNEGANSTKWPRGNNGIPNKWTVKDYPDE